MKEVHILCPLKSSKLAYVMDFIFVDQLGISYQMITDKTAFGISNDAVNITYALEPLPGAISVPYSDYFDSFTNARVPAFEKELLFDENATANFDLFAAAFYLLARVEEYDAVALDEHGRYHSKESILTKRGLLEFPIIDLWVQSLRNHIVRKFDIEMEIPEYKFISTIDVDHIYAYKEKPLHIKTGSLAKDLLTGKLQRVRDRFSDQDPYDKLSEMIAWNHAHDFHPHLFVLTAQRGPYDKSLSQDHPLFRDTIHKLSQKVQLGIHPSYASNENKALVKKEKQILEEITNSKVLASRQHYLKLQLPSTYRNLMEAGITEDHSMGYPDRLGFRAGTSLPFLWYDLEKDLTTELKVVPFQIMDVTMKKYQELDPVAAVEAASQIINTIKAVSGQLSIIWHNSSFYDQEGWAGWEEVYKQILSIASS